MATYGEPIANKGKDKWDLSEFKGRDSVDLLARMIYSEAEGEEYVGKQGVAHVAKNRKADGRFGETYEEVLLAESQFEGMTTKRAREPDLGSQAWKESLSIASNMAKQHNPIGNRLYFLPNKPKSSKAKDILQLGNHWFFNY
ncbi:cell wall hydrolase [Brevibacillus formosus]|uniref:Cell wall hydrolase SleB domain-containing protein n=1 Tax=Brevibacillus formosus TaxID=54913 RepID=A0A837KTD0_9BACL|nr:cell wall hydrolase [Brevibacillus formosus]KLH99429.1 hypothetical protein AA984_13125 [Brevibacillus formosus]MED1956850.1 cell wall hydrolase [Brevibacillus formosus]PSJ92922.1 hypothetical protein C7R91_21610 [Brevibacillus formosus]GED57248.1 hypothetical protein BFO01nite_13800 [Brevibacillus formosus]